MHLTLAVPGLLDVPAAALASLVALSRLSACATTALHSGIDTALLLTLHVDAAPAPLAALGAGLALPAQWIMRADPVTMTARRDDVRIDGRVDDLAPSEVAQLHELLSAHFASDGLAFHAPRADTWFVSSARRFDLDTTALAGTVGRALGSRLPGGADRALWRRWFTEVQMLLHEHPLTQRTPDPVNAIWFAEGGVLPAPAEVPALGVFACGGRDADVARGLAVVAGSAVRPVVPVAEALAMAGSVPNVVLMHERAADDSTPGAFGPSIDAAWRALERGGLQTLTLIADDRTGHAARWQATRPGWLQRLRQRASPARPFALPAAWDRR